MELEQILRHANLGLTFSPFSRTTKNNKGIQVLYVFLLPQTEETKLEDFCNVTNKTEGIIIHYSQIFWP